MGAMAYAQAGGALLGAAGGYSAAKGQRSAMNSQAWALDRNAQISDWQASQAVVNGQTNEEGVRLQEGQVFGRQRAALAANGVDLGYGSANDVLASTKVLGENAALQVHDNALREAWGYRTQAQGFRDQAALTRAGAAAIQPWMSAFTSLLGSATKSGFQFGSTKAPVNYGTPDSSVEGGGMTSGAGGFAGVFSDIRLKTNVRRLGTTARGNAWYSWDWKTGGRGEGVIAQEVAHIPGAVQAHANGFLMVDYSKV